MLKQLFLVCLAGAALVACDKKDAPADKPAEKTEKSAKAGEKPAPKAEAKKPAGHAIWGTLDLAAELKRLEGKWSVRASVGKKRQTWEIKGDKVTVTKDDGSVALGKLIMNKPGEVGLKQDSSTQYFAYTRNGEDIYLGLGRSGMKVGETFYVRADRGLVVFDGKSCNYHKEKMAFGGGPKKFEAPKAVKCELQSAGDKSVLHYQTPKFMKDGEFDDHQISVMGDALINDQLMGHKLEKATAAAAPAPAADPAKPATP